MLDRLVGRIRGFDSGDVFLVLTLLALVSVASGCTGLTSPKAQAQIPTPSPTLAITTSSLPAGQTGAAYQGTLAASGGSTPYTWSLSTGALPTGLSLNANSGAISGAPSASGTSSFTVQVKDSVSKTTQQALSIMVSAPVPATTDAYGGILARPCPDLTKTDWNLQKVTVGGKSHWVFCTPSGNVFIKRGVYYLTGDSHTDPTYVPVSYNSTANAKYFPLSADAQSDLSFARIKSWGFNAGGPGAYRHATDSAITNKVPFTEYLDSNVNNVVYWCVANSTCKNIWNLRWPPNWAFEGNAARNLVDAYDSVFQSFANTRYAGDTTLAAYKGSPYYMGAVTGDTDNYSGYGAGVDFPTDPPGSYWFHDSLWMLMSAPHATVNRWNSNTVYTDEINHTKAQMQTFFTARYVTIAALNNAWNSTYTTFGTSGTQVTGTSLNGSGTGPYTGTLTRTTSVDRYSILIKANGVAQGGDDGYGNLYGPGISSGTVNYTTGAISVTFTASVTNVTADYWHDGYGTGTGLLDEWGVNASHCWFPTDLYYLTGGCGTPTQVANFQKDMDDFLQQYSIQLFTVHKNAFKAVAPTKLFFGISNLGHVPGRSPARCPILKAAGAVLDVSQVSTDGSQAQIDFITNCLGDHPFTIWESVTANADSDIRTFPPGGPIGTWNKSTQGARGTQYQTDINNLWNNCNSTTGSCQWVGYDWWAYLNSSFYEFTNFGLVSWRDNAYDGTEDVMGAVTCSSPTNARACGGEQRNYGNFLGPVTTANKQIDAALAAP